MKDTDLHINNKDNKVEDINQGWYLVCTTWPSVLPPNLLIIISGINQKLLGKNSTSIKLWTIHINYSLLLGLGWVTHVLASISGGGDTYICHYSRK